jgi:predicted metal-dependent hydrolase
MLGRLKLYLKKPGRVLHYQSNVKEARTLIKSRVAIWAPVCGVTTKRIAIRNQKRSWGSCSSLGNLNFNYKLLYLPLCMVDYVVVHELCHLKFLNHSQDFWLEVGKYCPNYQVVVNEIRHLERHSRLSPVLLADYTAKHSCQYCRTENL